jgi:hypothetical protein
MDPNSEELARLIQEAVESDSTELSKRLSYLIGKATLRPAYVVNIIFTE